MIVDDSISGCIHAFDQLSQTEMTCWFDVDSSMLGTARLLNRRSQTGRFDIESTMIHRFWGHIAVDSTSNINKFVDIESTSHRRIIFCWDKRWVLHSEKWIVKRVTAGLIVDCKQPYCRQFWWWQHPCVDIHLRVPAAHDGTPVYRCQKMLLPALQKHFLFTLAFERLCRPWLSTTD